MSLSMITWNQNTEKKPLCHTDIDKFIVYIKIEDIYVDIVKDVEIIFNYSSYKLDRSLSKRKI